MAQTRPGDVPGLVLINPSVMHDSPLKPFAGVLSRVIASVPGLGDDIARPDADELPYDRVPLRAAASLFALQDLVRANLAAVRAPTLVRTSRVDHTVPPENSAIVLDGIAAPERSQLWLERSFHVATLDYDADVIADRTRAFIAQQHGAPATDGGADDPSPDICRCRTAMDDRTR